MKAGFAISIAAHAAVALGAMVTFAAPPPLDVPDVEAIPVEFIPVEAITKAVQGDREASVEQPPAPKPTTRPQKVPDAQNIGDAESDKVADAERKAPEPPVEKTEAPTPAARPPAPKPPEPEPEKQPEPEQDIAMLLKKQQTAEPEPEEAPVIDENAEETIKLPEKVATPKRRPKPPEQKPERNIADEIAKAKADAKKTSDAKKKATVNKADAAAGGAKRSDKKKAGLGTKQRSTGTTLAQSELDALRSRLEACWSVGALSGHPDADKMRARVTFQLAPDGTIDGRVKVKVTGTDRSTRATLSVNVRAAVTECAPYDNLPAEKYESWKDVVVNFSLAEML